MSITDDITFPRTYDTLSEAVQAFISKRLSEGQEKFTGEQLRFFVQNTMTGRVSPGSPDRVLRMLRKSGTVNYVVLNRGKSLYEARAVTVVPATITT